jgi:hypothetical protein
MARTFTDCRPHVPNLPARPRQIIYDLLVRSSSPLELREDPELGVVVAGLRHITVGNAAEIMVGPSRLV